MATIFVEQVTSIFVTKNGQKKYNKNQTNEEEVKKEKVNKIDPNEKKQKIVLPLFADFSDLSQNVSSLR